MVQYIDLHDPNPNGLAAQQWYRPTHIQSSTTRSRNRGTTHDETGAKAESRSRRVEIPLQSQRREGVDVAAGVETDVDSENTIAPGCRVSQSRGGRGREIHSSSVSVSRPGGPWADE